MIVRIHSAARQELLAAVQWYLDEGGPVVAQTFEAAVHQALELLAAMPGLGSPMHPNTRQWPLRRFPYVMVYRVQGDVLTCLALAHQRRAPGYWRSR